MDCKSEPPHVYGTAIVEAKWNNPYYEKCLIDIMFMCRRKSEPPGVLELQLVSHWLQLCLRCPGVGSRNKCMVLLGKLLVRQKGAVHAVRHRASVTSPGATGIIMQGACRWGFRARV